MCATVRMSVCVCVCLKQGPDKKTIDRLVKRMENSGRYKQIIVAIPGSLNGAEMRTVRIIHTHTHIHTKLACPCPSLLIVYNASILH